MKWFNVRQIGQNQKKYYAGPLSLKYTNTDYNRWITTKIHLLNLEIKLTLTKEYGESLKKSIKNSYKLNLRLNT